MEHKASYFKNRTIPYLLVAPQLVITILFFLWPAFEALKQAFFAGDAFAINSHFVGLQNFYDIFSDSSYLTSILTTVLFSFSVSFLALAGGLLLAVLTHRVVRGQRLYKVLLFWPYAVAPAIAGMLWMFLFYPATGAIAYFLQKIGINWDYMVNGKQAMLLITLTSVWQQLSYNFLFFMAGLYAIPHSLIEAAALDGAGPWRRFWVVIFPLLSPTTFFLFVINLNYAFFDTFGVVDVMTQGGPAESTNTLVYKVYHDGFVGLDLGGSAAQSVILMLIVIGLIIFQFRFIERKVHY